MGESEDLWAELRRSYAAGPAEFVAFCTRNAEPIFATFDAWRTVPVSIRGRVPDEAEYAELLIAVAQCFEDLGDSRLLSILTGDDENNPLVAWQIGFEQARVDFGEGNDSDVVRVLSAILESTAELRGTGADELRPATHGLLGASYYRLGEIALAVQHTELALTLCRAQSDQEGVTTYARNLRTMAEALSRN